MTRAALPPVPETAHVAILGKTGAGKTYAAKSLVEGWLRGGRQVCVVDPTGAWWGLRLRADGKTPAFPVVLLGGERGDLPLHERSGGAVARLVTEQGASVVLDTSELTVGQYTRWFADFAGTLFSTIRNPLRLVIDEAHYFAPQGRVPDPDAGRMLHACNRLMSGGRSRGIAGMLLTQRPQKLHKDSLTCADALIAMRVLAPQDRNAVREWIDGAGDAKLGAQVLDSLAQLDRGEAWYWHPESGPPQRVRFPKIQTYDSSAAPTGKERPAPGSIDLDALRKSMAEAVAEAEANDPKLLRAEITRLRGELSREQKADAGAIQTAIVEAEQEAVRRERNRQSDFLHELTQKLRGILSLIAAVGDRAAVDAKLPPVTTKAAARAAGAAAMRALNTTVQVATTRQEATAVVGAHGLSKGEAAVLAAIASRTNPTRRETLTVLTGYKRSSRDTYLQKLRAAGYIEETDGAFALTPKGLGPARCFPEPLTGGALREHWLRELPAGEGKVLRVLIQAHPRAVPREELSDLTGYKRSSRDTYLQKLRARELVEYDGNAPRASAVLFDGSGA